MNRRVDQILMEQLGVGLSQYRILRILHHSTAAQREIADNLSQTEAAISRQIKLLISKGLVQASVDESEKRKNIVSLTSPGLKVSLAASELLSAENSALLKPLTRKQQTALLEILEKVDFS